MDKLERRAIIIIIILILISYSYSCSWSLLLLLFIVGFVDTLAAGCSLHCSWLCLCFETTQVLNVMTGVFL